MPDDASITYWIRKVKHGDADAAQKLWGGYFHRLVKLRPKMRGGGRRAEDEEDAALRAFGKNEDSTASPKRKARASR